MTGRTFATEAAVMPGVDPVREIEAERDAVVRTLNAEIDDHKRDLDLLDAAEAALLVAQQERDAEHEARVSWETAARSQQRQWARAEATNTRLREALRLATYAFAQYAEAVEGFMDGFMQDADLRRLASDAEQENA